MDIIMEENSRLKSLLLSYQSREVEQRRHLASSDLVVDSRKLYLVNGDLKRKGGSLEDDDDDAKQKDFPFPEGDRRASGHSR